MFRLELLAMLVSLFQCLWRIDQLPHAVRSLMTNRKLNYVQSSTLSELLERKLSEPVYPQEEEDVATTSGIPPLHLWPTASRLKPALGPSRILASAGP